METCVVAGCTVDGTDLKDLWQDIQEGEINIHDYQGKKKMHTEKKDIMGIEKMMSTLLHIFIR